MIFSAWFCGCGVKKYPSFVIVEGWKRTFSKILACFIHCSKVGALKNGLDPINMVTSLVGVSRMAIGFLEEIWKNLWRSKYFSVEYREILTSQKAKPIGSTSYRQYRTRTQTRSPDVQASSVGDSELPLQSLGRGGERVVLHYKDYWA